MRGKKKKTTIKKIEEQVVEVVREHEIEMQILDWLNRQPQCMAVKYESMGVYDPTKKVFRKPGKFVQGVDIVGQWKKRGLPYAVPLWIEVKKPKAKTSPERLKMQKSFIEKVRRYGGIAFFANSIEEVRHQLEYFDKTGSVIV